MVIVRKTYRSKRVLILRTLILEKNRIEIPFIVQTGASFIELLKQKKMLKRENSSLILHMLLDKISCHIYIARDWYLAVVYLA